MSPRKGRTRERRITDEGKFDRNGIRKLDQSKGMSQGERALQTPTQVLEQVVRSHFAHPCKTDGCANESAPGAKYCPECKAVITARMLSELRASQ